MKTKQLLTERITAIEKSIECVNNGHQWRLTNIVQKYYPYGDGGHCIAHFKCTTCGLERELSGGIANKLANILIKANKELNK